MLDNVFYIFKVTFYNNIAQARSQCAKNLVKRSDFFYISESYDFYVKSSKKCFGGIDFYLFHIYFWSGFFFYFFDLLYAAALATKTNFGLHKNKYFPKRTTKLSNDIVSGGNPLFFHRFIA